MEEARILDHISIQKPLLILDNKFKVDFEIAEKGVLQAEAYLERERMSEDSNGTNVKYGIFNILKVSKLNARNTAGSKRADAGQ